MSFLERIRPAKLAEAEELKLRFASCPAARAAHLPVRDFHGALAGGGVIAEVKRKSPSHPGFVQTAAPGRLAAAYERNGAVALSLVVDEAHFGTSLSDVPALKAASALPVLVKDFVVDPVQVQAAWAAGADAVLLIARMLGATELRRNLEQATEIGLAALVECHDREDLDKAADAGALIVGVNNRDLASLTTDLAHGEKLLPLAPYDALRVAESGLYTPADVERMAAAGAHAFLIGHALLSSHDPGEVVRVLSGRRPAEGSRVKICGLTRPADAQAAHEAGADLLGLVFAPGPRRVEPSAAAAIRAAVPNARLCGVFLDQDADEIEAAAQSADLDLIQLHGTETPAFCRGVADRTGLPLIKALTADEAEPDAVARYDAVAYFLLDLPKGSPSGPAATEAVRSAALKLAGAGSRVFLAGGLEPSSVADARDERLYGYDVSRGVEAAPGIKDHDAIESFIRKATT